jgi:hypothetical protein
MYSRAVETFVRKQIYIRPAQERFLKQRAQVLGVTEAHLIRQAIDLLVRAPANDAIDERAWADEQAFLRLRAHATASSSSPWRFSREEIYQERLGQLPR